MSFETLQKNLREQGWLVEWNMPCCQSCAWSELPYEHKEGPFKGQEVDFSKVLFNHSQDCEIYDEDEEMCSGCDGEGLVEDPDYPDDCIECEYCSGEGFLSGSYDNLGYEPDTSVSGFTCMPPHIANESTFCFDGSKQGVKNLKAILPIIEECGCSIYWDGKGNCRPTISWK